MALRVRRIKVHPPEPAGPLHRVRVEIDGKAHATFYGEDADTAEAVADSYGFFQPEPTLTITTFSLTTDRHRAVVHSEFTDPLAFPDEVQAVFYAPTQQQAIDMAEAWIEGRA